MASLQTALLERISAACVLLRAGWMDTRAPKVHLLSQRPGHGYGSLVSRARVQGPGEYLVGRHSVLAPADATFTCGLDGTWSVYQGFLCTKNGQVWGSNQPLFFFLLLPIKEGGKV
jgi:hypothetical protein